MNKYIIYLFCFIIILFSNITIISCSERDFNDYYKYGKEATKLALKIDKVKEKYYLEYKDIDDLLETCSIIIKYDGYTHFDKYDILTIILKEGKFNQFAFNKNDHGQGLGQLTNIKEWHKKTLFWITNPYDKDQNIRGILITLEDNYRMYKTKEKAIMRYNGKTWKSKNYQKAVYKIKNEIKSIKI